MAFGFPAYFSESRAYTHQQHELAMALRSTFDDLGWKYEDLPNYHFVAKIPLNMLSWGESFKVEIYPNGYVTAESKSADPLQCIDYGRNKANVKMFFSKFELMLKIDLVD